MISKSPQGGIFDYVLDFKLEAKKINKFIKSERKTVVVQGLGFVGIAMVAALANVRDKRNRPVFNVIGVDLPDKNNYWKIARINLGKPPIVSADKKINSIYHNALKNKSLMATYSEYAYAKADIVVVDIDLGIEKKELGNPLKYNFTYDPFKKAIKVIANNIRENVLVLIETTVPPGTTEKIIYPIFKKVFKERELDINKLYLAYSYERVMPGKEYLNSVINFYRVYSGFNRNSKRKAKDFLETIINTKNYPLYKMYSTTACEMAKVLENSFRAMNIAFIQEWTDYAQRCDVNLFEVIEAIRMRPTHKNIMLPGFGVGGYCLPKDSLLADWSSVNFFNGKRHLETSLDAIAINDLMPGYTFELLKQKVINLKNKHVTILGVSYLNDIADTRNSPAGYFYDRCLKEKAIINLHDPVVSYWQEKNIKIDTNINNLKNKIHDIAVFTVRHSAYLAFKARDILSILPGVKVIIDANNIISDRIARKLAQRGVSVIGVGKGHWEHLGKNNE